MVPRTRMILAMFACLALSSLVWADSPVHYFAERTFEIPYSLDPDPTFARLHLHVSSDEGKTYSQAASTLETRGAFTYTARSDGWYFFVVQIERKDGSLTPAKVHLTQPSLRVCVDTEKPKATLQKAVPKKGGKLAVEWSVSDPNLDLQTLRVEYRVIGAPRWIPIKHDQLTRAQLEWNPTGDGPFEVRLLVSDKANHLTEVKTELPALGLGGGGGFPRSSGAIPPPGDRKVIYVNRKTFKLNYAIDGAGPSKVKHVEVWMTRDTSSWSIYKNNAPATGPCEVTVNAQGRYGFTLRPISGVGRGITPPRAGDYPQIWVEVDETPPTIRLHSVVVNEGADANTITVNWQASDKFFGETPITIYFATSNAPDARWEVLQPNVENTGSCKCKTDGLPFEFYVRVEATDRAGNKAADQTRETVKVDLSEPKVIEVNVSVGDPQ